MSSSFASMLASAVSSACEDLVPRDPAQRLSSIGVDAVHIPTWGGLLKAGGPALLARTYTNAEIEFSAGRVERLAARFAAKEAVSKALGTGLRGLAFSEIEVTRTLDGKPGIGLHNRAKVRSAQLGIERIELSLCHEEDYALAVVVGVRRDTTSEEKS